MGTSKQANAIKEIRDAHAKGLQGFVDKDVVALFKDSHKAANAESKAAATKAQAAYELCRYANALRYSDDNRNLSDEAFEQGWVYSMKGILPALKTARVSWVEKTQRKLADGSIKHGYKLTSYGQNLSSNAKAAAVWLKPEDMEQLDSLQGIRKAIKKRRDIVAEAELTDEQRKCNELAEQLKTGFALLSKLLADAESAEAYEMELVAMAEAVERNTPIEAEDGSEDGEAEDEPEAAAA